MTTHLCLTQNPDGFVCTLESGHSGNHKAHGDDRGHVCKEWNEKFEVRCAWCQDDSPSSVPISHGICQKHYDEMIARIEKEAA